MTCPFCQAALASTADEPQIGDLGGIWTRAEHSCAGCGVRIGYSLIEKLGQIREAWDLGLDDPPRFPPATTAHAELRCPRCETGLLVGTRPPDADDRYLRPQPAGIAVRRTLEVEYICSACPTRLWRADDRWSILVELTRHARGGTRRYEPLDPPPLNLPIRAP